MLRDPAGWDGAGPRVLLRPGRCFPAVCFPGGPFPLRDSHISPGVERVSDGTDGVPLSPGSVKCSPWLLGKP